MRRIRAFVLSVVAAAVLATPAAGAVFIKLATNRVQRGGMVRVVGNAAHLAVYALPARHMPCANYGTCPGPIHRATAPNGPPFIFLGYTPGTTTEMTSTRSFVIRLPRALPPGPYFLFVWCRPCGGSLIVAASDPSGQPETLHVLR
jgi:hypothetical protein